MKRYFSLIIGLLAFVAVAVISAQKIKAKTVEADREASFARIQTEYLERVGWIRANPDEKSYKDEVNAFFRWYFKEISQHQNRFGLPKTFDGYLEELSRRTEEKGKDPQAAEKKATYEYVKSRFEQLRAADYSPVFSASDKGMRLDVLSAEVLDEGSAPKIRFPIMVWGAQRELREDNRGVKKMVTSANFHVTFKLFDKTGKLFGEMSASGDPSMRVDFPERFIAEFPRQTILGHFDLDLIPAEIAKVEIVYNVSSTSPTGGSANASFTWKMDAPENWKMKPGQKWEGAEESVRSEEEINPGSQASNE